MTQAFRKFNNIFLLQLNYVQNVLFNYVFAQDVVIIDGNQLRMLLLQGKNSFLVSSAFTQVITVRSQKSGQLIIKNDAKCGTRCFNCCTLPDIVANNIT